MSLTGGIFKSESMRCVVASPQVSDDIQYRPSLDRIARFTRAKDDTRHELEILREPPLPTIQKNCSEKTLAAPPVTNDTKTKPDSGSSLSPVLMPFIKQRSRLGQSSAVAKTPGSLYHLPELKAFPQVCQQASRSTLHFEVRL